MRLLDHLREGHARRSSIAASIAEWWISQSETKTCDIELRRGQFGGPYNPPSITTSLGAKVFIRWADGLCSKGSLDRGRLDRHEEALELLRSQAYVEPYPDQVPREVDPSQVKVYCPKVHEAVCSDPGGLIRPMSQVERELSSLPPEHVRSSLSAVHQRTVFASSAGADATYEETNVHFSVVLASRAWCVHEVRRLPSLEDLLIRVSRARRDLEYMEKPFEGKVSSPKVVLAPRLASQFFNFFMNKNFSMQAILNRSSAFSLSELEQNAQLFHPSLTIRDAPARNYHSTAFQLDERGQPGRTRELVREGKLVGVDVSLRAATQGRIEPTPVSLTGNWLLGEECSSQSPHSETDLGVCLESMEDGVFVYSVLGLHTQDPTRGSYSLGVPRAIVVRKGRIQGFVRGTLVGNFFDDLRVPLNPLYDPLAEKPILPVRGVFTQSD